MNRKDLNKSIKKELKKNKLEWINYLWIFKIIVISFAISIGFSIFSEAFVPNVNIVVGIIILFVFILIGIIFDMIGVAVQTSDIAPFHSMNSRKIKGADVAVLLIKNADKVSSICNDVVGDICGIVSGSAGFIIASKINDSVIVILLITGLISALTIGGKAIGKTLAINKSNYIIYEISKLISNFYKRKK